MKDAFRFKKFSVCQRRSAMKVGTDGVLLGAWANGGNNILDIGAGTGIISLMMAQRFPEAKVTGVEIDHDAAEEAAENAASSPFADRVEIVETSLQDFIPKAKFDAIVSNPPFFNHGFHVADNARRMARQTETLSFADILHFAHEWLEPHGELSVVLPTEAVEDFSSEAFMRGFFVARKYLVKTVPRKQAKRCLVSFSLTRPTAFDTAEVVLNTADGKRSPWYNDLTKDFYFL